MVVALSSAEMPRRRAVAPREPWAAMVERVRGYAGRAGRDPVALGIDARVDGGDLDALVRAAEEWRRLGATHVSVSIQPLGAPPRPASEYLDRIERIRSVLGGVGGDVDAAATTAISAPVARSTAR